MAWTDSDLNREWTKDQINKFAVDYPSAITETAAQLRDFLKNRLKALENGYPKVSPNPESYPYCYGSALVGWDGAYSSAICGLDDEPRWSYKDYQSLEGACIMAYGWDIGHERLESLWGGEKPHLSDKEFAEIADLARKIYLWQEKQILQIEEWAKQPDYDGYVSLIYYADTNTYDLERVGWNTFIPASTIMGNLADAIRQGSHCQFMRDIMMFATLYGSKEHAQKVAQIWDPATDMKSLFPCLARRNHNRGGR